MLKIAICDDVKSELTIIENHIHAMNLPFPYEITCFENCLDLIHIYTQRYTFDILILDMRMQPLNGIDVAEALRKVDTDLPILIVTSTVDYAVEGYRINAFRYLVKPVNQEEFQEVMEQIIKRLKKRNESSFTFSNNTGTLSLCLKDIYYLESNLRSIKVVSTKGVHHFTGKISALESELSPHGFLRVHKSFLVNISKIHAIHKDFLTLDSLENIPISKHKKKDINQQFLAYMESIL